MGKVCKKCGYARKPHDTGPDYECPNCGAVYAKVEAQIARKAAAEGGAPRSKPTRQKSEFKAPPALQRAMHLLLVIVSWILAIAGIINLLAGDYKLALLTLPASIVAIPALRRPVPQIGQVLIITLLIVGIAVNNFLETSSKNERLEREAAERTERREQYARQRAERLAEFKLRKPTLLSESRLQLSDGNVGAVLAVTAEWADVQDTDLKKLEQDALRSAERALAEGNYGFLNGFNESDFPQFARLNAEAQRLRTAANARAEAEACRKDLQCWGDKHTVTAGFLCDNHVERLAKYSFEWTDGLLQPKFSHFRWKSQATGAITYIGDKIRFQNGFGAWQNYIYECDLDPLAEAVLDVRARPGRL